MKKLLLGSIIITSSVITSIAIHNNYIPRIDTSKVGLVEYKNIPKLTPNLDILKKLILKARVKQEKERLKYIEEQEQLKKEKDIDRKVEFTLSFYTSLPEENGGHTVTCKGEKLKYGMVASNVYKLGTKISLKDYGVFTVSDRGGSNFNSPNRLDVLIERNGGENDTEYLNRVNNMGKYTVTGYIENKKNK
ncbi:hypothetical protein [Clostridium sardiniense]|uniref:hypothetical protein n=1 Tax=Clostridium sardiniense TaxID=29369 RepID=UPI00195E06EC|nr:hypothetical protein [Clostridium sardiniense]MBM7836486.1 3D (Asp-Asp-Asp) domain-containing protein [Clostridium sardiniense]